jgi:hypothetical protein
MAYGIEFGHQFSIGHIQSNLDGNSWGEMLNGWHKTPNGVEMLPRLEKDCIAFTDHVFP